VRLTWTTTDAQNISIAPEVGAVTAQGSTTVTPADSAPTPSPPPVPAAVPTPACASPSPCLLLPSWKRPRPLLSMSSSSRKSAMPTSITTRRTFALTLARPLARPPTSSATIRNSRHHRRPLRRTRLHRIQPCPRRSPRQRRQAVSRRLGHSCRPTHHGQLWQGKALLHRIRRSLLSTESPRPLHPNQVTRGLNNSARNLAHPSRSPSEGWAFLRSTPPGSPTVIPPARRRRERSDPLFSSAPLSGASRSAICAPRALRRGGGIPAQSLGLASLFAFRISLFEFRSSIPAS